MNINSSSRNQDRSKKKGASPVLLFLAGLLILLLFGWVAFPGILYVERNQPLDFNHRMHTKISDNGCESCHLFRPDGSFSGIPGIENCRTCHAQAVMKGAEETKLVREYLQPDIKIPWHVYARQPDSVFFTHAAHVRSAGLTCETCHGNIGQSTAARPYQENVITGYSRDIWGRNMVLSAGQSLFKKPVQPSGRDMKMDDCVNCHLDANVIGTSVQTEKEGCFVCHK